MDKFIRTIELFDENICRSLIETFESTKDKWVEVDIPIEDFKPTWRGYNYSDYPAIEIEEVNSLGLHISDKQEGEFKLEIEYIKAIY